MKANNIDCPKCNGNCLVGTDGAYVVIECKDCGFTDSEYVDGV